MLGLRRATTALLFLYIASLFVSMASLELTCWTMTLATLIGVAANRRPAFYGCEWRPFRLGIDGVIWALVASVAFGWYLNRARGSDLWFVLGGVRWVATLYILAWVLRWRNASPVVLVPYLFSLFVAGVYGIVTSLTAWDFARHRAVEFILPDGLARAVSFLGFPMTWGHTSAMALCFCIGLLLVRPFSKNLKCRRWLCAFAVGAAGLTAVNLALTFTRGAWIGAIAGILGMAALKGRKALIFAIAIGSICVAALFFGNHNLRERMETIFSTETSSNVQRIQLWEANWLMFTDHPWFGVGLNENEDLVPEYHRKLGRPDAFSGHAHSNYLQFLASSGAVGFALFMTLFGFYLYWSVRLWRIVPLDQVWHRGMILGSFGAQIALHVGGLTECDFKAMTVNHHFIFQLALIAALRELYRGRRTFA